MTIALTPSTEEELADIIKTATGPLSLRGGGTRGGWAGGTPLTTAGLTGITLYEPQALTMVARAGTPLSEITKTLAASGQRLDFEPPMAGLLAGAASTIGGVFAADASGPRRVLAGAARDALLGIRAVDGHGRIFANGGRVMKNVTGLDLVRLFAGSQGRLGVMTEVAFKVLPAPEVTRTLMCQGLPVATAVALMSRALGSDCAVSGACHIAPADGPARTLLRLEGSENSTAERVARLEAKLSTLLRDTDLPSPAREIAEVPFIDWSALADLTGWSGQNGALWRVTCKPSDAAAIWAVIMAAAPTAQLRLDWGGGLLWALLPPTTNPRALLPAGATATRLGDDGPDLPPRRMPQSVGVARLEAGLERAFDPRGLFRGGQV